MGEGFIERPADPERAQELSSVSTEWLTNNGDVDVKILDVTAVYSNVQGYFYNVQFSSEAGEGMLRIVHENGSWIVKEV